MEPISYPDREIMISQQPDCSIYVCSASIVYCVVQYNRLTLYSVPQFQRASSMHVFQQSNLVQQQQSGTSQVRYSYVNTIGHVNEYPTMNYFGIPIRSRSMIA